MRHIPALFCASLMLITQGCSIRPLQQDVTHSKTTQLVDHIRCEARAAMESKVITLLEQYSDQSTTSVELRDQSKDLAKKLQADHRLFRRDLKPELKGKDELGFYKRYHDMAIAFNFLFDITESENGSAQIDLLKPFRPAAAGIALGISGSASLKRENIRSFVVTEQFGELLEDTKLMCPEDVTDENFVYPISGTIGLKELIDTFVDLDQDRELQASDKNQVFADQLTFTTTFGLAINPKVTFVTAGRGVQVGDAPLTSGASRSDEHQVIIGLARAKSGDVPAKKLAAEATKDLRVDIYLNNFGTIFGR